MNEALMDLWYAFRKDVPFDQSFGIIKYWVEHYNELGSPIGLEHRDGNNTYQAFVRGIVRWTPNGPDVL